MVISKKALILEAHNRQAKSKEFTGITLPYDFAQQDAFVDDTAKDLAAQCSRRAGKTNGLAKRFFKTLFKYPNCQCVYLALTRDSAKNILWPILIELNEKYNLGCTFLESKLTMKCPNGAKLTLYGADMQNFIRRLKGGKYPGVGIDEAQDFGGHLSSLIDDVLKPATADYADGWIALTGTPGPVPQGLFFEITTKGLHSYSVHKWTMFDNPFMPGAMEFVTSLKKKRQWADDNPTYLREYLNQWVLDVDSLWVKYTAHINDYTELPKEHKWNYILGVDIGFKDADAVAVVAWSETSPVTYLVEEQIATKQGVGDLITMIDALQKKYDAYKIVMDEGGLGKKLAEDLRTRFGVPLEAADKAHKQTNVELLNDALRLGKFKAKAKSRFAQDSYLVQIDWEKSTPNRIIIKKKPHSDIIDAVLYAFRESYAYSHTPAANKPRYGSKEWADQQSTEMFEKELEGYQKQEDYDKWAKGEWE
jgi:hypothetical protein